jgi:hypothetical protein
MVLMSLNAKREMQIEPMKIQSAILNLKSEIT